ncbi:MAG: EAL domain-containing protein [Acidimicrobiales bacterium]|nr:EAL domain-containing protein [Acidimicrobiales bacterium]MCB9392042.1 EAL domain-containing protein [Acidimicrobiaceae bacterium]
MAALDQRRFYRLAAILRSIAIALSATALVWEFAGQHPWVAVAVAVWMYPGIAVNWWLYRRLGVIPPHVWMRDVLGLAVFAALVPTYLVPAMMAMLAIVAVVSITVVRRTVRVIAATVVLASLVSAWVGGAEHAVLAAVCLPLAVLAILLPSQLLSQTMQRSLAFNTGIADAMGIAMFESESVSGQPADMIHLYAPESRRFGPAMTEQEWVDLLHPDDTSVSDVIDANVAAGRGYRVRYRQLNEEGVYHWVEEIGRVRRDGQRVHVVGMTRDIDDQIATEEQLVVLERMADTIDIGITILRLDDLDDPRSLVLEWGNRAATGVTLMSEAMGRRLADVLPSLFETADPHLGVGLVMAEVAAGASSRRIGEVPVPFADGTLRPCRLIVSPLPDHRCAVVFDDVSELAEARADLERLAFVDPLTGLPNRQRTRRLIADAPVGSLLMVIDLDRFADVNEAFGHGCGDEMIVEVARVLAEAPEGAVVGRIGGDEFGVVAVPGTGERDDLVTRLFQALSRPVVLPNGLTLQASISMGITTKTKADTSPDELLRQADVALAKAKVVRNRHEVYDPRQDTSAPHRMMLLGELRRALLSGELELHHQPAIDTHTGRISSVESMLVWQHPSLGLIPACDLTDMVQRSNLHADILLFSMREAIRHYGAWAAAGHAVPVSINIDATGLRDESLVDRLVALVRSAGLPEHALGVEIDETQLRVERDLSADTLRRLADAGLWLTIDHAGTSRNPLGVLRSYSVDAVKIDGDVCAELRSTDDELIGALVAAVHHVGLLIAAAGADDEETFRWLIDHGADQVQGSWVGALVPHDVLLGMLLAHEPLRLVAG